MFLSRSNEYNINISYLSEIQYTIENNSFYFQIKKSDHLAFSDITAGASIQVVAHYGDNNEIYQTDYYPSYNDFTPPGTDLTNMLDNLDDTYGISPNSFVDIEEISIQFIE